MGTKENGTVSYARHNLKRNLKFYSKVVCSSLISKRFGNVDTETITDVKKPADVVLGRSVIPGKTKR